MARAGLLLGVRDLAQAAQVSPTTITRLERGEVLQTRTVEAIRSALEKAGAEFTNGDAPGVRLPARSLGWIRLIEGQPSTLIEEPARQEGHVLVRVGTGDEREIPRAEWEAAPVAPNLG